MSGNGWGPWIGWNGPRGDRPCGDHVVVEFINEHNHRSIDKCGNLWFDNIIAYRVKKEPIVEVKYVNAMHPENDEVLQLEYTYTDGKLTKIHWDASDAN